MPNQKPLGSLGEQQAFEYLKKRKFYKLLDRNYRTRWGELDLIMVAPDKTIVFVEVKSRLKQEGESPLEQIDTPKIGHLKKAIAIYLNHRNWQDRSCRLDAVGIEFEALTDTFAEPTVISITHIEDLTGW